MRGWGSEPKNRSIMLNEKNISDPGAVPGTSTTEGVKKVRRGVEYH